MVIGQKIKRKFHLIEIEISIIKNKIPVTEMQIGNVDYPPYCHSKKPAAFFKC